MRYGNVYVAQVAMGADYSQTLRALLEAESYPGTSIVIAYAPCISHGIKIGMNNTMLEMSARCRPAIGTLFRYDPSPSGEGKNPLPLDSPAPLWTTRSSLQARFVTPPAQLSPSPAEDPRISSPRRRKRMKYQRLLELSKQVQRKRNIA